MEIENKDILNNSIQCLLQHIKDPSITDDMLISDFLNIIRLQNLDSYLSFIDFVMGVTKNIKTEIETMPTLQDTPNIGTHLKILYSDISNLTLKAIESTNDVMETLMKADPTFLGTRTKYGAPNITIISISLLCSYILLGFYKILKFVKSTTVSTPNEFTECIKHIRHEITEATNMLEELTDIVDKTLSPNETDVPIKADIKQPEINDDTQNLKPETIETSIDDSKNNQIADIDTIKKTLNDIYSQAEDLQTFFINFISMYTETSELNNSNIMPSFMCGTKWFIFMIVFALNGVKLHKAIDSTCHCKAGDSQNEMTIDDEVSTNNTSITAINNSEQTIDDEELSTTDFDEEELF